MVRFKRTLAIMYIDLLRSNLKPTSKKRFDKGILEWRNKQEGTNLKKEVAKQHQLLHLLYPKLGTVLPYEVAAVDVLKRMASDAGMTKSQAHSWACNAAGLDKDAWSKEMAGLTSLGHRVSSASFNAKRALQNKR
jgi:hypothetical protein